MGLKAKIVAFAFILCKIVCWAGFTRISLRAIWDITLDDFFFCLALAFANVVGQNQK